MQLENFNLYGTRDRVSEQESERERASRAYMITYNAANSNFTTSCIRKNDDDSTQKEFLL